MVAREGGTFGGTSSRQASPRWKDDARRPGERRVIDCAQPTGQPPPPSAATSHPRGRRRRQADQRRGRGDGVWPRVHSPSATELRPAAALRQRGLRWGRARARRGGALHGRRGLGVARRPARGLAASVAGVLLMGWIVVELAFIREVSFFHPVFFLVGLLFVIAGRRTAAAAQIVTDHPAPEVGSFRMTRVTTPDAANDDLGLNRALWTQINEEYTDQRAATAWAAEEITSGGCSNVPDGRVGALGDVDGLDVVNLGCGTAYVSAWLARLRPGAVGWTCAGTAGRPRRRLPRSRSGLLPACGGGRHRHPASLGQLRPGRQRIRRRASGVTRPAGWRRRRRLLAPAVGWCSSSTACWCRCVCRTRRGTPASPLARGGPVPGPVA